MNRDKFRHRLEKTVHKAVSSRERRRVLIAQINKLVDELLKQNDGQDKNSAGGASKAAGIEGGLSRPED